MNRPAATGPARTYRQVWEAPRRFKSDKWDHYLDVYERHFARFRAAPITYLEIGVQAGGGLCVAREYFAPGSRILGLDIDPESRAVEQAGIADRVFTGSQSDIPFLVSMMEEIGAAPDIIVDDGSHMQSDMMDSFITLFPRLAEHGCYVVEDTHSVHLATHQHSATGLDIYDYFKGLAGKLSLDFMVPEHRSGRFRRPPEKREGKLAQRNTMASMIESIHFYNSMIVIEKAPHREPWRRHG